MAHRRGRGGSGSAPEGLGSRPMTRLRTEVEKGESIPLHAGHLPRHGAERSIHLLLIPKPLLQHFHRYVVALELAGQPCSCRGQAWVAVSLGELLQKRLRGADPQVRFLGHQRGALASPLREVAFGVGLKTPGEAAHQELFVVGARLLPEHFPVLDPQLTYALLSQAVNFAPHRCVWMSFIFVHSFGSLVPLCMVSPACGNGLAVRFSGTSRIMAAEE